jgi:hypothetical protein
MYKMLSALYAYQSGLMGLVDEFVSSIKTDEDSLYPFPCFLSTQVEKIIVLKSFQLFIQIEAIVLSSNKPITGILEELEANYTDMIQKLAAAKCQIEHAPETLDMDAYVHLANLQDILAENISDLNKVAIRYFQRTVDDLNTFAEYFAIAKAQHVYGKLVEEKLMHSADDLEEEELSQLVYGVSMQEAWDESTPFNYHDFTPDEIEVIQRNLQIVRSEQFNVSFNSKSMDIITKKELTDEQIVRLFTYLKEHEFITNTTRKAFKEAITNQTIRKPIIWQKSKTDAHRFRMLCGWSYNDFNDRFVLLDDTKLTKGTLPKEGFNSDFKIFCDELDGKNFFTPTRFR